MDFEQMKMIWNTQEDNPLYALDREALQSSIEHNSSWMSRHFNVLERITMLVPLGLAGYASYRPLWYTYLSYDLVNAGLFLVIFFFLYSIYRRRHRLTNSKTNTLLDDLNNAIALSEERKARVKSQVTWLLIPFLAIGAFNYFVYSTYKPFWYWPLILATFIASFWIINRSPEARRLPPQRDLRNLRDTLLQAETK